MADDKTVSIKLEATGQDQVRAAFQAASKDVQGMASATKSSADVAAQNTERLKQMLAGGAKDVAAAYKQMVDEQNTAATAGVQANNKLSISAEQLQAHMRQTGLTATQAAKDLGATGDDVNKAVAALRLYDQAQKDAAQAAKQAADEEKQAAKDAADEEKKSKRQAANAAKEQADAEKAAAKQIVDAQRDVMNSTREQREMFRGVRNTGVALGMAGYAGSRAFNNAADFANLADHADLALDAMMKKRGEGAFVEQEQAALDDLAARAHMKSVIPLQKSAVELEGFGIDRNRINEALPGLIGQARTYAQKEGGEFDVEEYAKQLGKNLSSGNVIGLRRIGITLTPEDVDKINMIKASGASWAEQSQQIFAIVSKSMHDYALGVDEGMSESEKASNDAARAIEKTQKQIGEGAAAARADIDKMGASLLGLFGASEGANHAAGAIGYVASEALQGVGAVAAFVGQLGLGATALKMFGETKQGQAIIQRLPFVGKKPSEPAADTEQAVSADAASQAKIDANARASASDTETATNKTAATQAEAADDAEQSASARAAADAKIQANARASASDDEAASNKTAATQVDVAADAEQSGAAQLAAQQKIAANQAASESDVEAAGVKTLTTSQQVQADADAALAARAEAEAMGQLKLFDDAATESAGVEAGAQRVKAQAMADATVAARAEAEAMGQLTLFEDASAESAGANAIAQQTQAAAATEAGIASEGAATKAGLLGSIGKLAMTDLSAASLTAKLNVAGIAVAAAYVTGAIAYNVGQQIGWLDKEQSYVDRLTTGWHRLKDFILHTHEADADARKQNEIDAQDRLDAKTAADAQAVDAGTMTQVDADKKRLQREYETEKSLADSARLQIQDFTNNSLLPGQVARDANQARYGRFFHSQEEKDTAIKEATTEYLKHHDLMEQKKQQIDAQNTVPVAPPAMPSFDASSYQSAAAQLNASMAGYNTALDGSASDLDSADQATRDATERVKQLGDQLRTIETQLTEARSKKDKAEVTRLEGLKQQVTEEERAAKNAETAARQAETQARHLAELNKKISEAQSKAAADMANVQATVAEHREDRAIRHQEREQVRKVEQAKKARLIDEETASQQIQNIHELAELQRNQRAAERKRDAAKAEAAKTLSDAQAEAARETGPGAAQAKAAIMRAAQTLANSKLADAALEYQDAEEDLADKMKELKDSSTDLSTAMKDVIRNFLNHTGTMQQSSEALNNSQPTSRPAWMTAAEEQQYRYAGLDMQGLPPIRNIPIADNRFRGEGVFGISNKLQAATDSGLFETAADRQYAEASSYNPRINVPIQATMSQGPHGIIFHFSGQYEAGYDDVMPDGPFSEKLNKHMPGAMGRLVNNY